MPVPRKILILSLTRRRNPISAGYTGQPRLFPPKSVYLRLVVRLLHFLGYKFKAVSTALTAPPGKYACLTFDNADDSLKRLVAPTLDELGVPATVFVTTSPNPAQLAWPEIKSFLGKGWEIGSLGHELVDLTERSHSEQQKLISQAKALLLAHIGTVPKLFAYPFGAYDATTVSCVRDEGYSAALTLCCGVNDGNNAEPFHLRRVPLHGAILRDLWLVLKTVFFASRRESKSVIGAARGRDRLASTRAGVVS